MTHQVENVIEHRFAEVNGVKLHYVIGGEGPTVMLLHGFPDFWYTWKEQIPMLIEAGYRVVAPDLRGYNLSSKPEGVDHYSIDTLCADVNGLIEHLGEEQVFLTGHDWGGNISWYFTMMYPHRVRRLAILNMLHPERLQTGLRTLPQLRRSWYMFFFQIPKLPEKTLARDNNHMLRTIFKKEPKEPFSDQEVQVYLKAFEQKETLSAAINYYRAMFRRSTETKKAQMRKIEQPVLILFGDLDPHLSKDLADPLPEWVPDTEIHHYDDATHWIQHDKPAEVGNRLIQFFR